ncbi:MAG: zf-HC2 domain-containing protein [Deltaproteobacteria bacterium]|nr:zf-HC2 domain-containing protein [Deltaproteobacteria bacterium]
MDCKEARAILEEAIDGRLPPSRASALAAHLAGCVSCAAEEEKLRRVGEMLRLWTAAREEEKAPQFDALWTRVQARIRERERTAGAPDWLRRWFWLPAAVVLAVLTLLFYPSDVNRAPFHPRNFEVSVETLESDTATVALVEKGDDLPPVIWIIEDGKT